MTEFNYMLDIDTGTAPWDTIFKLRGDNPDALIVFLFYIEKASYLKSKTIPVITSSRGKELDWNEARFNAAEEYLIENKFLILKDTKLILNAAPMTIFSRWWAMQQWAIKKDIIYPNSYKKVLNRWNSNFKDVQGVSTHRSLDAQVARYREKGVYQYKTINEAIDIVVKNGCSLEQIVFAIDNYREAVYLKPFLTSWVSLGTFLYSGPNTKSGVFKFLRASETSVEDLRKLFHPITVKFDPQSILDVTNNTYYGFHTENLKQMSVGGYMSDIKHYIKEDKFDYGHFNWLEKVIAALLFSRKKTDRPDFINELREMLRFWTRYKPVFEEKARKNLDDW